MYFYVLHQKNIEDIQCFGVEYGIYFTHETLVKISKILSHSWNKFHIQRQNIELYVYYISMVF